MSGRQWKPGDVAYSDAFGLLVAAENGFWFSATKGRELSTPWRPRDGLAMFPALRPLVVIDPEDREQVERLIQAYCTSPESRRHSWSRPPFDMVQAALRSLVAPPKPPEPIGLGAVVEDAEGRRYVRTLASTIPWIDGDDSADSYEWRDLPAVKVLSEGVS